MTSSPAACDTIGGFLRDTKASPEDFDMILTGDLSTVGSKLLCELMLRQEGVDISFVHADCGLLMYDVKHQKVNSGGSGCGCSAAVLCSHILRRLEEGELHRVLFVGTGALMSAVSSLQKESIPAIAHAVCISGVKR